MPVATSRFFSPSNQFTSAESGRERAARMGHRQSDGFPTLSGDKSRSCQVGSVLRPSQIRDHRA